MMLSKAVLLLPLLVVCADAWGWEGHQIVGKIAETLINANAAAKVKDILSNDQCGPSAPCPYGPTLSGCASWADDVKNKDPWAWTRPVHYVDTPDSKDLKSCSYSYASDCYDHNYGGGKGLCVTGGINNATTQLQANAINWNATIDAACSLKFLVHYVGDVHQPLHVGFTSDRGGNLEDVEWFGQTQSKGHQYILHALWDYDIIERYEAAEYPSQGFKAWEAWAMDLAKNVTDDQKKQWGCDKQWPDCVDDWATESINYACSNAYETVSGESIAFTNGTKLADPYYEKNLPLVAQRLAQGGVRLAAILNSIWQ